MALVAPPRPPLAASPGRHAPARGFIALAILLASAIIAPATIAIAAR